MARKIISFIFVVSLAFGIINPNQAEDVPFDVNEVIRQVSHRPNEPRLFNSEVGEFLIDTSIVYAPIPNNQYAPSVTFDGTNYLVVWTDKRNGCDIYGCRVNQTSVILDPNGIPISTAAGSQKESSVAFDGTNYFVVWQDTRNSLSRDDIYGARVNQEGVVLDPNGIAISIAAERQRYPSVAFDGTNYLVVWEDYRSGHTNEDIYGARVNQFGVIIDTNGIPISTALYSQENPDIAFDGTNYIVVWQDYYDICGARVNQDGVVLDTNGINILRRAGYQKEPSVAFDGTNYLVVWQDERWDSYYIYGARVNRTGVVLDPEGFRISAIGGGSPSVAFDGTNYLVVWEQNNIYGARVSQSGVVLDSTGFAISIPTNDQESPSIAFDGTNYFVVWKDRRSSIDIYGAQVNQNGTVLDTTGFAISTAPHWQYSPSVVSNGFNYFVAWHDRRTGSYDIHGARVNQAGVVLDPSSIAISTAIRRQWFPSIAFDGTNYLVVWDDERNGPSDIYGARVSQTGEVIDSSGIAISTAVDQQERPFIAFDGTNYLVVWQDYRCEYEWDIYGARVDQSGVILDTSGIVITTATNDQEYPSIVFDGIDYLVVWQDYRDGYPDIYGTRVSQAGTVLDTNGIRISTTGGGFPSIAFDGINYLIVWQHDDIYGARVNQYGVVLDSTSIPISTATGVQATPSVTFDGTNYFVIWEDGREGYGFDIYGAKLNPAGVVIDSFIITDQTGNQYSPRVVCGVGNQILITYSGWTDSINQHPASAMRIWGKFYQFVELTEEYSNVKMQSAKLLEVYPNPARSFLAVRLPFSADRQTLKIFDVAGKMIKEIEILRGVYPASFEKRDCFASARNDKRCGAQNDGAGDTEISLKGIKSGIYFLRFGKQTKKFLVVK